MKKVSKIFSVILAIIMVMSALPVYANETDVTMTISSDITDVKAGDTVTVSVLLSENSQFGAFVGDIYYDSDVLEFIPYPEEEQDISFNGVGIVYNTNVAGKVRITFASNNPITAGGSIIDMQFSVKESVCSSVTLEVSESIDTAENVLTTTVVPAILHSYGEWVTETEPACETVGQKSKSCTCGDKITESIDALGHDYATDFTTDTEPKCTEAGSKSQHCSRCDSKQNVTEIPATGHSFGEWITETDPTCTMAGKDNRVCSACGETETQEIPATDHTEEEIPAAAPTCTETGLTAGVKCSVCDEILTEQTVVPATGHDYNEEVTKIPTHTENGEKTFTCNNCGDTYTETIEADGDHKHVPAVTKEPTCTETGVMTYTCVCGDAYTEDIPVLGHTSADSAEENYIAPTCTEKGSRDVVIYCSVCDTELDRQNEILDELGHTLGNTVEENYVAPTCTVAGGKDLVTYCTVCGDDVIRESVTLNPVGHTEETLPAVAPTCTETGLTAGVKCSVCDEILTAQTVVPATGHSYTNGICSVCDSEDPDYYTFSVQEPSRTTIRNKDGIILHANVEGNRPAGSYVEWTTNNSNFKTTEMNDGDSLKVIAENKGDTIFTATLYDADRNILATDTVELYSKSGFFDKIGGFFRSLFRITTVYEY